jgi:hypothetical protein
LSVIRPPAEPLLARWSYEPEAGAEADLPTSGMIEQGAVAAGVSPAVPTEESRGPDFTVEDFCKWCKIVRRGASTDLCH